MDFVIPVRSLNRTHFTTAQKLAILDQYDQCVEPGSKVALARGVGVGYTTLSSWVKARGAGTLSSRSDTLKGQHMSEDNRLNLGGKKLLRKLQKDNEMLRSKLEKSEAAVDILGKASALLAAMAKSAAATDPVEEPEPGRPAWLNPKPGKQ